MRQYTILGRDGGEESAMASMGGTVLHETNSMQKNSCCLTYTQRVLNVPVSSVLLYWEYEATRLLGRFYHYFFLLLPTLFSNADT